MILYSFISTCHFSLIFLFFLSVTLSSSRCSAQQFLCYRYWYYVHSVFLGPSSIWISEWAHCQLHTGLHPFYPWTVSSPYLPAPEWVINREPAPEGVSNRDASPEWVLHRQPDPEWVTHRQPDHEWVTHRQPVPEWVQHRSPERVNPTGPAPEWVLHRQPVPEWVIPGQPVPEWVLDRQPVPEWVQHRSPERVNPMGPAPEWVIYRQPDPEWVINSDWRVEDLCHYLHAGDHVHVLCAGYQRGRWKPAGRNRCHNHTAE